jgi:hypothetical protein
MNTHQCFLTPQDTLNTPVACNAGFYSSTDRTACVQCPAGSSCNNNASPTLCTIGEYSLAGKTACTPCPAGRRCADVYTAPVVCSAGTYALAGAIACTVCPKGHRCPSITLATETPCVAGLPLSSHQLVPSHTVVGTIQHSRYCPISRNVQYRSKVKLH